jgi:hypothetical protein
MRLEIRLHVMEQIAGPSEESGPSGQLHASLVC